MRSQSGNYNYSKTFFPLGYIQHISSWKGGMLIYSPLHIQHVITEVTEANDQQDV